MSESCGHGMGGADPYLVDDQGDRGPALGADQTPRLRSIGVSVNVATVKS